MIVKYNDDVEIKISDIDNIVCGSFINWWITGKIDIINDEIKDEKNVRGIVLNRHYIKSLKFEKEI